MAQVIYIQNTEVYNPIMHEFEKYLILIFDLNLLQDHFSDLDLFEF